MEKLRIDSIALLTKGVADRIVKKEPYSNLMVTSLSIEAFKLAYREEITEEGLAYQRGLENGMKLILSIMDEINKQDDTQT